MDVSGNVLAYEGNTRYGR